MSKVRKTKNLHIGGGFDGFLKEERIFGDVQTGARRHLPVETAADRREFRLTAEQYDAFVAALDAPQKSRPRLERLLKGDVK